MATTPRYGFHAPDPTDSNNPPADFLTLATQVEQRLGVVEDTFVVVPGFAPTIRTGSATGSVWNIDAQAGWRRKAYGVIQAWSQSRNGDNGPAVGQPSLSHYVTLPYPALSGFAGSLGTFAYLDPSGGGSVAGNILLTAGATAGRLVPTGGPGFATSNQYLLVCNWHYPAA